MREYLQTNVGRLEAAIEFVDDAIADMPILRERLPWYERDEFDALTQRMKDVLSLLQALETDMERFGPPKENGK